MSLRWTLTTPPIAGPQLRQIGQAVLHVFIQDAAGIGTPIVLKVRETTVYPRSNTDRCDRATERPGGSSTSTRLRQVVEQHTQTPSENPTGTRQLRISVPLDINSVRVIEWSPSHSELEIEALQPCPAIRHTYTALTTRVQRLLRNAR